MGEPWLVPGEPQSNEGLQDNTRPWVPRLLALSSGGKCLGGGRGWREGRGALGFGGAATDSLTSGNKSLPRLVSTTSSPLQSLWQSWRKERAACGLLS